MQTLLPYVVAVTIVVLFLLMLWLASKEKLIAALLAGALCTMCLGFYPAMQWWGFGEIIAETIQGEEGVEVVAASPVRKPVSVVLWLVLFAVPGPFLAVAAQVFFRSIKRVRTADVDHR
jgi:hypothetical protein